MAVAGAESWFVQFLGIDILLNGEAATENVVPIRSLDTVGVRTHWEVIDPVPRSASVAAGLVKNREMIVFPTGTVALAREVVGSVVTHDLEKRLPFVLFTSQYDLKVTMMPRRTSTERDALHARLRSSRPSARFQVVPAWRPARNESDGWGKRAVLSHRASLEAPVEWRDVQRIVVHSRLVGGRDIPQGAPLASIRLADGQTFRLKAGIDTAETVHDSKVGHRQAPVIEATRLEVLHGRREEGAVYRGVFTLDAPADVPWLTIEHEAEEGILVIEDMLP